MEQRPKTPLEKLVLLILADCHNAETNACFPSMPHIADKAGCTPRGAIKAIESLEKQGFISIKKEQGKSNQYELDPCTQFTRAHSSPVNTVHVTREHSSGVPVNTVHPNLEINQESNRELIHAPRKKPKPQAVRPDSVSPEVWQDFLTLRKTKRAPLTETALDGIRREADRAGYSLENALRTCCERGWQGFRSDWVDQRNTLEKQTDELLGIDRRFYVGKGPGGVDGNPPGVAVLEDRPQRSGRGLVRFGG